MHYINLLIVTFLLIAVSCKPNNNNNDDDDTVLPTESNYVIVNEGAFGAGNASLSLYNSLENKVYNDVFHNKNNRTLGDVAQSALVHNNKVFVALNVSNKIEVANASDISQLGVISPISLPRYMTAENDLLYVTSWGEGGQVYQIDAANYQVLDSIAVGTGPEQILRKEKKLFVANSGGFTEDSTVSIVDISGALAVNKTLTVGDIPIDLVEDGSGSIWVLCKGKTLYNSSYQVIGHTESELVQIDATTEQVLVSLPMFADEHPSHLEISPDGTTVYMGGGYGFNGIYRLNLTGSSIVPMKIIDVEAYGFNVHPTTGDIYVLEAPDFISGGNLKIYSNQGILLETHTVGVGPNGIVF